MQPTLASVPSVKPTETCTPALRAADRRRSISSPSMRKASLTRARKKSWLWIGARSAAQTGKPGMKLSGKATSEAPARAASRIRLTALSTVAALSRNTADTWHAAALKRG